MKLRNLKKIANLCKYGILTIISILVVNCNVSDKLEKGMAEVTQIHSLLSSNSSCELVDFPSLSSVNGKREILNLKLIGCEFQDVNKEVDRIHKLLSDSLNYFCDIKTVNYYFVNKGEVTDFKYYKCSQI